MPIFSVVTSSVLVLGYSSVYGTPDGLQRARELPLLLRAIIASSASATRALKRAFKSLAMGSCAGQTLTLTQVRTCCYKHSLTGTFSQVLGHLQAYKQQHAGIALEWQCHMCVCQHSRDSWTQERVMSSIVTPTATWKFCCLALLLTRAHSVPSPPRYSSSCA